MKWGTSKKTKEQTGVLVRPPPRLKISEFAEKEVWIPSEGNAEPGKYRLARMPHQIEMLDDPLDPSVREIFWMLASQAGGKTLCLIVIGMYIVQQLRKSLLMVRATKETAAEWMVDKFLPTIRETPCVRGLLKDTRERGSESKAINRKFRGGGSAKIVGANSPAAFRGASTGKVLQDEIDSYKPTKEGDPCALADRAAITFTDAWKIKASTPTLKGFSKIDAGFESGDQRRYFLPCWQCGEFQWLKPEQLKFSWTKEEHSRLEAGDTADWKSALQKWEIGDFPIRDTKRAIYVCEHCHCGWTDIQRMWAYFSGHPSNAPVIVNGKELRAHWRAGAPFTGIRSRQMNGMYLTIGLKQGMESYLHMFAEDFLKAKREGREALMVRMNTFDCKAFEDPHEKLDWKTIKDRAEEYGGGLGAELPVQVMWMAFGADVQPDRVEFLSYGWGDEQEAWCIEHHVIYGDFDMPAMQERVEQYLLNKRFKHPILGELSYSAGAFDSGHQTKVQAVYRFCAKHALSNFWSVKGFDAALGAVFQVAKEKRFGGRRFNLNVDYLKTMVFDRLKNVGEGPRRIHFPKEEYQRLAAAGKEDAETRRRGDAEKEPEYVTVRTGFDARFYLQLCSEKRIAVKKPKGGFELQWVKLSSSTRNEVLDMTVYAFGVFEVCRQEEWIARKWKEVEKQIKERNPPSALPATEGGASAQPAGPKEYVLGEVPKDKKIPELVERGDKHKAPPRPQPGRRKIRINSPFSGWKGYK